MIELDCNDPKAAVFIVHGRDTHPVEELQAFLRSLHLAVLTVGQLNSEPVGPLSIHKIFIDGISKADVTIVLLTPDEAVALYDPVTGDLDSRQTGWRARPKVIFELGVAFGRAENKVILATLGQVREMSDIGGIYGLPLRAKDAKLRLAGKLAAILGRSYLAEEDTSLDNS
jgi:predicted nucleotide-binding protein